jgi:dolichol-phosphate mannosyltransferase
MKTAFVIPCYNEVDGIPQLCDRLHPLIDELSKRQKVGIIFVDDGSTDGTADRIRDCARGLPYEIVAHERNRGLGAALRTGFSASGSDEVVTLDSDCTYDPMEALQLLEVLRAGNDVVTGSPYHPKGEVVNVALWRLLLSKTLSRMYWLILPNRLYTYTSCFRAYRRETIQKLRFESDDFLAVAEIIISAVLQGAKVAEVPTRLNSRRYGASKIKVVKVSISHLKYMARVAWLRLSA